MRMSEALQIGAELRLFWSVSRGQSVGAPLRGIEAQIQTGCGKDKVTFIPRIPLLTSEVPFQFMWHNVIAFKLKFNIRAEIYGDRNSGLFAQNLLELGEGKAPVDSDNKVNISTFSTVVQSVNKLTGKVFPNFSYHYKDFSWLCEMAILETKCVNVNSINQRLLHNIPGDPYIYISIDTVIDQNQVVNYSTEFLNSLEVPGLPSHQLQFKVGAPMMLLRNLNQPKLCNGTRLIIQALRPHVIEAQIQTGCGKGEGTFITRGAVSVQVLTISSETKFCHVDQQMAGTNNENC